MIIMDNAKPVTLPTAVRVKGVEVGDLGGDLVLQVDAEAVAGVVIHVLLTLFYRGWVGYLSHLTNNG